MPIATGARYTTSIGGGRRAPGRAPAAAAAQRRQRPPEDRQRACREQTPAAARGPAIELGDQLGARVGGDRVGRRQREQPGPGRGQRAGVGVEPRALELAAEALGRPGRTGDRAIEPGRGQAPLADAPPGLAQPQRGHEPRRVRRLALEQRAQLGQRRVGILGGGRRRRSWAAATASKPPSAPPTRPARRARLGPRQPAVAVVVDDPAPQRARPGQIAGGLGQRRGLGQRVVGPAPVGGRGRQRLERGPRARRVAGGQAGWRR
jgi:hypothetical protein